MRRVVKIGATVLVALGVLSAPALAADGGNIFRELGGFRLDIDPLDVVGLTDDQRLVRFNTLLPQGWHGAGRRSPACWATPP